MIAKLIQAGYLKYAKRHDVDAIESTLAELRKVGKGALAKLLTRTIRRLQLDVTNGEVALSAANVIGHKFKVGQVVYFRPKRGSQTSGPPGPYQITKQLPERDGEFQYRIRNAYEEHERVAAESELSRV
jgi:hypothetical protein